MKPKEIIIGIVVALGAGVGAYFLIRPHQHAAASGNEEAKTPSRVSVQVGSLKRATLRRYVEGYGAIAAAPALANQPAAGAPLAPPNAGVVARVEVVAGQKVKRGDVLMELNSGASSIELARQQLVCRL